MFIFFKKCFDYLYLKIKGIETQFGYVRLLGLPIIKKCPGSLIKLGKGVTLVSESKYNIAGINHPVIISTLTKEAEIIIGDFCGFSGTSIVAANSVIIKSKTMFGVNTGIYDTDFHVVDEKNRVKNNNFKNVKSKPVNIGKNVWLGANVLVLKGVAIGDNSVAGANSLICKNVKENELVAGNPAKFIRKILIDK